MSYIPKSCTQVGHTFFINIAFANMNHCRSHFFSEITKPSFYETCFEFSHTFWNKLASTNKCFQIGNQVLGGCYQLCSLKSRTTKEEIVFTARPKIQSQSQIYGRSIFCLPHWPNFLDMYL